MFWQLTCIDRCVIPVLKSCVVPQPCYLASFCAQQIGGGGGGGLFSLTSMTDNAAVMCPNSNLSALMLGCISASACLYG